MNEGLLPIHSSHPFWISVTGSRLKLTLSDKETCLQSLVLIVYSVSKPYVYRLEITQRGSLPDISYHKKKEAIKIIKNEWWKYYGSKTVVEFEKHTNFIPPQFISTEDNYSNSSSLDSCPPTPSPRSLRKTSLKNIISRKPIPKKFTYSSDSESFASNSSSPISNNSPRSFVSSSKSSPRSNNSPRSFTSSPRNNNSPRMNLSGDIPKRSSTPKTPVKNMSGDIPRFFKPMTSRTPKNLSGEIPIRNRSNKNLRELSQKSKNSSEESPRNSPRSSSGTFSLLKKVSVKLSIKENPNKSDDEKSDEKQVRVIPLDE